MNGTERKRIEGVNLIKIIEDNDEYGTCKCGKKATVKCYGGPEPGEYCFDCNMKMLYRINGMEFQESQ